MRVRLVVLTQQILAVVVAVRGSDDGMDVRRVRNAGGHQMAQPDRLLVIELDQDHRTVDAVIEDEVAILARATPRPASGSIQRVEIWTFTGARHTRIVGPVSIR